MTLSCKDCEYTASNQKAYEKHVNSKKHKNVLSKSSEDIKIEDDESDDDINTKDKKDLIALLYKTKLDHKQELLDSQTGLLKQKDEMINYLQRSTREYGIMARMTMNILSSLMEDFRNDVCECGDDDEDGEDEEDDEFHKLITGTDESPRTSSK
jgi:hypothetical protein